jgi:hypothetical protein
MEELPLLMRNRFVCVLDNCKSFACLKALGIVCQLIALVGCASQSSLSPSQALNSPVPSKYITTTGYLSCERLDAVYQCRDTILSVTFEYPVTWGEAKASLGSSTAEGAYNYAYGMSFAHKAGMYTGGQGKWNGGSGMGGSFNTFQGGGRFDSAKEICAYQTEYVCIWPHSNVLLQLHVPGADEICRGPSMDYDYPGMARLMLNLPDNNKIGGFIFVTPFISSPTVRDMDMVLEVQNGKGNKCDDATRALYDAKRDALVEAVRTGTADEDTMRAVNDLRAMAESIHFLDAP